jgi:site-specific DNA-methyltransferase (adenine-specific)
MNPETNTIYCGDCLEVMKDWPDNCIDSIVTDPPAGISFMGKQWDGDKGGRDKWIQWLSGIMVEAGRLLKPGGHAFVWALPRTSHWTGLALENAGFEIRDCIYHVFGSGFPKSLDISKAIDKQAWAERAIIGSNPNARPNQQGKHPLTMSGPYIYKPVTASCTLNAKRWSGWGTALKPAVECWWLARKPLSENTVAENVLKWGTGGLNIDACRIETEDNLNGGVYSGEYREGDTGTWQTQDRSGGKGSGFRRGIGEYQQPRGRFPANLVHDGSEEVLAEFAKAGNRRPAGTVSKRNTANGMFGLGHDGKENVMHNDTGSAARFFYCAKPSRREREAGLEDINNLFEQREGMDAVDGERVNRHEVGEVWIDRQDGKGRVPVNRRYLASRNNHPTVKPVALMRYLIRLITPPGGIVLDMFAGSGSTLVAAIREGMGFVGIEISPEYCKIAERRVGAVMEVEPRRKEGDSNGDG